MAINYRLLPEVVYPQHYLDCARAIQFARQHAKDWNIDKTKVGERETERQTSVVRVDENENFEFEKRTGRRSSASFYQANRNCRARRRNAGIKGVGGDFKGDFRPRAGDLFRFNARRF